MNFAAAAADMHRQELARLSHYVTPTPEQLRAMTAAALSAEIAGMWERLGHEVITNPDDAAELVHRMGARKFITACANPSDATPTRSAAIRHLRDRVVAASAERGFFFSVHGFTAEALHYAEAAPVQSVDCAQLVRELRRSREGMKLPQTYKAMCRQCGDIVQHRIDRKETLPCENGHPVAPPISRADLIKPTPKPAPSQTVTGQPAPASSPAIIRYRNMSAKAQRRRAIKAHNRRAWAGAAHRQN